MPRPPVWPGRVERPDLGAGHGDDERCCVGAGAEPPPDRKPGRTGCAGARPAGAGAVHGRQVPVRERQVPARVREGTAPELRRHWGWRRCWCRHVVPARAGAGAGVGASATGAAATGAGAGLAPRRPGRGPRRQGPVGARREQGPMLSPRRRRRQKPLRLPQRRQPQQRGYSRRRHRSRWRSRSRCRALDRLLDLDRHRTRASMRELLAHLRLATLGHRRAGARRGRQGQRLGRLGRFFLFGHALLVLAPLRPVNRRRSSDSRASAPPHPQSVE